MFKRSLMVFLCFMLLLTGCHNNNVLKDQNDNDSQELPTYDKLNLVWKDQLDFSNEIVEYEVSSYTPKVPDYRVAENLSNIKNLDRFNGFSNEQIGKLVNNGFVVLDPNPERAYLYMKMYDIYENNEYKQIPSFITVDVALHMYHKFFGQTLKGIEEEKLFEALQQLTENMLNKTQILYLDEGNMSIKEELESILVYFSVANKLINDTYGDIPSELAEIALKEIENIDKAEGYVKSSLFGFDINYEQFIVRGHYAGNETLEKYFKTMMWYGLIGYPFEDEIGNPDFESITKALMTTYIAFLEIEENDDISLWDKIYSPTNFFVGQSDDITIFDLKGVIIEVYGEKVQLKDFKDESYHEKLIKEIDELPQPGIQNKLITGAVDTPTGKQFRFMGQRYTLDANIMQELMFPIIRPVPTGLDVAGAFGNERAEGLAKEGYLHELQSAKYEEELQKMKNKVQALSLSDWQYNLYNGWLWVLKKVWSPEMQPVGLPFFMKNQAWQDKNLQTGLGSYAEIKHDTILYAKQPVAEMGGGEELQEHYPNYVEPAVEVYNRLLWLVQFSRINLEKRELLTERGEIALKELEDLYLLLRDCSIKQLENIPITEEENNALKYIGGRMERIDNTLSPEYDRPVSSAIIADVAGIADFGLFLEIATGLPNEIYVAVYDEERVYLARGVVYSYYEFLNDKPLTDQQWHEMLGVEKIEEYEWHYQRINPEMLLKNSPPQPDWVKSFKSTGANRVEISDIEYNLE
ncbi:DUF3160 domain-containing protein [Alkaliphilus peptidifermentans]|uniref:YARHG domain-containing protein n=1 Tax=Alkaliphilus peptidifermentans DSM 18978 TaxID=1120976 RepID=A0A1G5JLZ5_9FIRM|nr:DUF3160 domain-containing protein [Alkaliphilus peptidifermentans]SCY89383.1 Protein of unknown function [Alkaliphilus peptidifermentans DSM 18978]